MCLDEIYIAYRTLHPCTFVETRTKDFMQCILNYQLIVHHGRTESQTS